MVIPRFMNKWRKKKNKKKSKALYLIGQHEDGLHGEAPGAEVEQVFQTGS